MEPRGTVLLSWQCPIVPHAATFSNAEGMGECEMCGATLMIPDAAQWSEMRRFDQEKSDVAVAAELSSTIEQAAQWEREQASSRRTRRGRRPTAQPAAAPAAPALSCWQVPPADMMTLVMPALEDYVSSWRRAGQLSRGWLAAVVAWVSDEAKAIIIDDTVGPKRLLGFVGRRCTRLQEFTIRDCHAAGLGDEVKLLGSSCSLRKVDLQGCIDVSTEAVALHVLLTKPGGQSIVELNVKGTAASMQVVSANPGYGMRLQILRLTWNVYGELLHLHCRACSSWSSQFHQLSFPTDGHVWIALH